MRGDQGEDRYVTRGDLGEDRYVMEGDLEEDRYVMIYAVVATERQPEQDLDVMRGG